MNMSLGMFRRAGSGALLALILCASPGFAQRLARKRPQHALPHDPKTAAQLPNRAPGFAPNRYIVFLSDQPVAARYTAHAQLETAAALSYRQQIEAKQQSVIRDLASRTIQVVGSASTVANAIFVVATPDRLAELRSMPGVAGVMPERMVFPSLNKAVAAANASNAWTRVGGQASAGKGILIGILDTGIDAGSVHTSPAFVDSGFTAPSGFPKCNATVPGTASDCGRFTNNKVIVARSYVSMIAAGNCSAAGQSGPCASAGTASAATSMPDDYSARDRDGHGSAVAAAAAAVQNSGGTVAFSGMAPAAYLGSYKIYGSPGVSYYPPESVVIQALDDAIKDGMNVINFSGGAPAVAGAKDDVQCGNSKGVPCDPLANAFETAAANGTVITVAAGNYGTDLAGAAYYNSITSPGTAPSVITVGATINSHVFGPTVSVAGTSAPSNLKNLNAEVSDSFFLPSVVGANSAPLVDITQAPVNNNGQACTALPAGTLTDMYALIQESSTCTFDVQAQNAVTAGALGVIWYMNTSSTTLDIPDQICIDGPNYPSSCDLYGPGVMISQTDGQNLKKYLDANTFGSVTVLIDSAGIEQSLPSSLTANTLAVFSSLGPAIDGTLKPDMVATGGIDPYYSFYPAYLHGFYTVGQSYDPNGNYYSANGYLAADGAAIYPAGTGTSFAAPLVAGAAAMVKQAHPSWTAAQIKSALVNYSAQDVTADDYGNAVDAQEIGGGRLDANAAVAATVTAVPSTLSYGYLTTKSTLPIKIPVTLSNSTSSAITLKVAVSAGPFGSTSATPTPDQTSLTVPANGTATLNVSLTGSITSAGEYAGAVNLSSTSPVIAFQIPYLFLVGDGSSPTPLPLFDVPDWQYFGVTFNTESTVNHDIGPLPVQVVDSWGVPVAGASVTYAAQTSGTVTFKTVPGTPGSTGNVESFQPSSCTPSSSTSSVTCTTNSYGIAWVELGAGATAANAANAVAVNIAAAGVTITDYVTILPVPSVTSVLDAGAFGTTIAPGSYASLFGANMVDPSTLNLSSDFYSFQSADSSLSGGRLPLEWGLVTVSFDAPASGSLPALSVPGYVYYISTSQVNIYVPWELENYPSANVKMSYGFGSQPIQSNVMNVPLANYVPAYLLNGPYGTPASFFVADARDNTTGALITTANPATAGEILQLYCNGLGPVSNQPASGDPAPSYPNLAQTTTAVTVTIGGKQVSPIFAGLTPPFVGLYLVDIAVPSGLTSGNQPITVTVGGKTSPASITGSNGTVYQIMLPVK